MEVDPRTPTGGFCSSSVFVSASTAIFAEDVILFVTAIAPRLSTLKRLTVVRERRWVRRTVPLAYYGQIGTSATMADAASSPKTVVVDRSEAQRRRPDAAYETAIRMRSSNRRTALSSRSRMVPPLCPGPMSPGWSPPSCVSSSAHRRPRASRNTTGSGTTMVPHWRRCVAGSLSSVIEEECVTGEANRTRVDDHPQSSGSCWPGWT